MSAVAAKPSTVANSAIPFSRLLGVEFRKSWDTRAGFWLLATIGLLVAAAEVIALLVAITQDQSMTWMDYGSIAGTIISLLLPVLAIMLVTNEWSQRTAMVTFSLEPRRSRVIWAKLVVSVALAIATVAFALLAGLVCVAITAAAGGETALWEDGFAAGMAGFTITQVLTMLVGFGLAALLLNTATAIVVFFAYSFVLPMIMFAGASLIGWFADIAPWINFADSQSKLFELGSMTGEEWAQFGVTTVIWIVVPLVLGLRRILRAEVK